MLPIVKAGPNAIRNQKVLMRSWESMSPVDAARTGIDALAAAFDTDEPHRMIQPVVDHLLERRRQKAAAS